MTAGGATDRITRLLALVPYLTARPDGVGVAEAARDFGVPEKQLRKDLELLWMCGLPGYGPGDLIDLAFEGDRVRVGITDYAQDALGDVVFVGLPAVGTAVTAGNAVSEVESTKSVSDIYAPVSGTVVEVNDALADGPDALNQDPYGDGWLFVIELADAAEVDALLDAPAYRALTEA